MQNTAMNRPIDSDSVRLKAYELWVTGGKREGVAVQNWLEAERILRSTEATVSTHAVPSAQAVSGPKIEAPTESKPPVQSVPTSTPPLALSEISTANKPVPKAGGKGGSGRRR